MRRKGKTHAICRAPRLAFADFFEQQSGKIFPLEQQAYVRLIERRIVDQGTKHVSATRYEQPRYFTDVRRLRGLRIILIFKRHVTQPAKASRKDARPCARRRLPEKFQDEIFSRAGRRWRARNPGASPASGCARTHHRISPAETVALSSRVDGSRSWPGCSTQSP